MERRGSSCQYCGDNLVFVPFVKKKDGTVIYPKAGKFLVFCANKKCKRK